MSFVQLNELYPSFDDKIELGKQIQQTIMPALEGDAFPRVQELLVLGLQAADEGTFGFEEAGKIVGLWFGLVVAAATLPVAALDGPLPFLDAAWLLTSARFTLKSVEMGGNIGEIIDDIIS